MSGFPSHIVESAWGPDALAATHRRAEQQREQQPRWLAGLIARHGEPVTFQPEPITLGASRFQTWAWVGCGVQVEQTLTTWTVSAHRRGRLAKLAGLERYPTDAEISGVVALAGLDDAPAPVPGSSRRVQEADADVLEKAKPWATPCGRCDYGEPTVGCTCPEGDPRPVMSRLAAEIERLRNAQGWDPTSPQHAVIRAAINWRKAISDGGAEQPEVWAVREDLALIEAVDALPHIGDDAPGRAS